MQRSSCFIVSSLSKIMGAILLHLTRNHSCQPNTVLDPVVDANIKVPSVYVRALTDIARGDEIVITSHQGASSVRFLYPLLEANKLHVSAEWVSQRRASWSGALLC
jgi:hypothetical protein